MPSLNARASLSSSRLVAPPSCPASGAQTDCQRRSGEGGCCRARGRPRLVRGGAQLLRTGEDAAGTLGPGALRPGNPSARPEAPRVSSVGLRGLVLVFALGTGSAGGADPDPALGTNLNGVRDWSPAHPFLNLFKYSRPWLTQCDAGQQPDCTSANAWDTGESAQLDVDAHGWVRSLPEPGDAPTYWIASTFWALDDDYSGGRHVVQYDGQGSIQYALGASLVAGDSQPGRHVIDIHDPASGVLLRITATDPGGTGDYIRNITVVPESQADVDPTDEPFNPTYLQRLQPFQAVRFMNWMRTNNSPQASWAQRPLPDDARYTGPGGVPIELMIRLANTLDQHAWFTVPHMVDDNYVQQFAQVALAQLEAGIEVYLEYSNEVWNGIFSQAQWVEQQGMAAWPDDPASPFTKRINWFGMRTAQVCDLWKGVWGDAADRVHCVMGAQAANSWTATQAMDCPLWTNGPCHAHGIDAVATAPYFGGYLGSPAWESTVEGWTMNPDGGFDALFAELDPAALEQAYAWIADNRAAADTYGVALLAYEGGQHLAGFNGVENNGAITALFTGANREPRMGDLYRQYFPGWRARGGGLFMQFTDIGAYSKWGSWGALEHLGQANSPKYQGLLDYLELVGAGDVLFADGFELLQAVSP